MTTRRRKKSPTQLDREIAATLARSRRKSPQHLLTSNRLIVIESDGDSDTMTWKDFAEANQEMPELEDVAAELRRHGRATIGGGAAPLTVVRLADQD